MSKSRDEYTEANRIAWNEAAPRHAEHNNAELFEAVRDPAYVSFEGEILNTLRRIDLAGKSIIQLGCNNARESLSMVNLGAAHAVGVDAAAEFLEHGREMLANAPAGDRVELLESDIYGLPSELDHQFDLVLITIGVISWMPDLPGFFEVVRRLLKPGGQLVMEEMHPVLFMYEEDPEGGPSKPQYSYFSEDGWEETTGLDYYGHVAYESHPNFSFMHRLDQVLMSALSAKLKLEYFRELDVDISNFCSDLEQSPVKPPLGFVLVMAAE